MANEIITDAGIITVGGSTDTVVIGGATYTGTAYSQNQIGTALADKQTVAAQGCSYTGTRLVSGANTNQRFVADGISLCRNTIQCDPDSGDIIVNGCALESRRDLLITGSIFADNNLGVYGWKSNAYFSKGGAIFHSGTATISGSTFTGNTAYSFAEMDASAISTGGAIHTSSGVLKLDACVFDGNVAVTDAQRNLKSFGGAIHVEIGSIVTIDTCAFLNNVASARGSEESHYSQSRGGAIYNAGTATISGSTFSGNTLHSFSGYELADKEGGAVYNEGIGSSMVIRDSVFVTASDTIYNNGNLTLGGTITTAAQIDSLNAIVVETGTKLVLDLSVYSETNNAAFLANYDTAFSSSEDNFDIAVKVNAEQTEGDYILASAVGGFSKSITLTCGGETTAALALENYIIFKEHIYSLAMKSSNLVLTVSTGIPAGIVTENGDKKRLSIGGNIYAGTAYKQDQISQAISEMQIVVAQDVTLGRFELEIDKSFVGDGITMSGNTTTDDGGAVYSSGTATITNSTFSGNMAYFGGAVFSDGTATITNSTFSGNTAAGLGGGAVCNRDERSVATITDSMFSGNTAAGDGGAVYCRGTATITNSTFSGNMAFSGGAVSSDGTATITNSTFSGNMAASDGGAVLNNGTVTITASTFSGNMAHAGGAVSNDGTVTITDSVFSGNTAEVGGAVLNNEGGTLTIRDSIFATASDTIYNDGTLTLGGTIKTAAEIDSIHAITIEIGTKLLLDLSCYSGTELTNGLLFNYNTAFAPQQENLTIFVNVGINQEAGEYVLASGIGKAGFAASSFDFFVDDSAAALFSVTVGSSTRYGGKDYSLAVDDGKLTLSISDFAVYVSNEWTGLSDNKQVDLPNGKTAFIGFNAFDNLTDAKTKYPGAKISFAGGSYGTVIFGGSESGDVAAVNANTSLAFLDGVFGKSVFAGNKIKTTENFQPISADSTLEIQGGSYSAYVMGGDYLSTAQPSAAFAYTVGKRSMNISGGTFEGLVAGGSFIAGGTATLLSQLDGDIDVTISGGTFNDRIYGGDITDKKENSRTDIINGDISFTLDATQNSIHIGENIVCGSYGEGTTKGDVVFTVKGAAANLTFADTSVVNGGSGNGYLKVANGKTVKEYENYVNGTSTAVFDGFDGEFTARLTLFDAISFSKGADVSLTNAKCNLAELSAWSFADGASVAFCDDQINDFTGDTLDIDLTKWDQTTPWTLATGSSEDVFHGFSSFSSVKFNGVEGDWDDGNSRWLSASGDFALSLSEDKKSMVLAQVC